MIKCIQKITPKSFLDAELKPGIEIKICCDMSPAFIKGAADNFSQAKVTFDKFHVMKDLRLSLQEFWNIDDITAAASYLQKKFELEAKNNEAN